MDNIWSNIRRDSQYQKEKVEDWAAHLKHLQSILREFHTECAQSESLLGRYFYEGLRPSIKLWIDEESQEQLGWDNLIKKATKAEAKAKLQGPSSRDLDQRCPRGNWLLYAKLTAKEPCDKQSKKAQPKAASPQSKPLNGLQQSK